MSRGRRDRLAARTAATCLAALLAWLPSCSGGSDSADVIPTPVAADFDADAAPPAAASVSLQKSAAAADVAIVDVVITDTTGVFGVAFDLTFDPAQAEFLSAEEGGLLDGDGADTEFLVSPSAGRLVVGATRLQDPGNTVPDVDASGPQVLASFRFRLLGFGGSRVDFDPAAPRSVTDRDGLPRPVSWAGGTLLGL